MLVKQLLGFIYTAYISSTSSLNSFFHNLYQLSQGYTKRMFVPYFLSNYFDSRCVIGVK